MSQKKREVVDNPDVPAPGRRPGRPRGALSKRTLTIGRILDHIVPDRELAKLLWKMAKGGDSRVATYIADRKWGRVKQELEHAPSLEGGPLLVQHEHVITYITPHRDGHARLDAAQAAHRPAQAALPATTARRQGRGGRVGQAVGQDQRGD